MGAATAYSRGILATALCAAAIGLAPSASAQPGSLRDGLFGRRPTEGRPLAAPPVARYISEDGAVFILDRTAPKPLLKFEGSPEIWSLQPQPAPRGDVIYKNDLGEPMLRTTKLGGVTLFTIERPGGSAAALDGSGAPIRLAPIGPQALIERLGQASLRASRAARRLVPFDAEATPESSALIADAAMVTSEAMVRMSRHPERRSWLVRILRVRLTEGRRASATLDQGTLTIYVAPPQGVGGRPSSERIVRLAGAPPGGVKATSP